jgi:HlyD family secretion protein
MTANVAIEVDRKDKVLKVPNASLRFRPAGTDEEAGAAATRTGQAHADSGGDPAWADATREQLVRDLGLSDAQKQAAAVILQRTRQQIDALQSQRMPSTERRERARITRESGWAEFRGILTPAQQVRYDKLSADDGRAAGSALGQVWVLGPDGRPRAVSVRLGIGDSRFTEIREGDLGEGQDVIVGSTDDASQKPTRGSRIRM